MLTHKQILEIVLLSLKGGGIISTVDNCVTFKIVMHPHHSVEEYVNLFTASAAMYRVLDAVQEGLEDAIEILEDDETQNNEDVASGLLELAASIKLVKELAVTGARDIAERFKGKP